MSKIKMAFATAALCGVTATGASAMPIAPIPTDTAAKIEHVRWVCNPYGRCWWRPNYYRHYGFAYYPRHRHWRHRHW